MSWDPLGEIARQGRPMTSEKVGTRGTQWRWPSLVTCQEGFNWISHLRTRYFHCHARHSSLLRFCSPGYHGPNDVQVHPTSSPPYGATGLIWTGILQARFCILKIPVSTTFLFLPIVKYSLWHSHFFAFNLGCDDSGFCASGEHRNFRGNYVWERKKVLHYAPFRPHPFSPPPPRNAPVRCLHVHPLPVPLIYDKVSNTRFVAWKSSLCIWNSSLTSDCRIWNWTFDRPSISKYSLFPHWDHFGSKLVRATTREQIGAPQGDR